MLASRVLLAAGGSGGFVVPSIPFSGALVTRSTDLSVGNDTFQLVDWDTEEYDTDDYFDLGADDRFTIPTTGYYIFGAAGRWKATNNTDPGVRGIGVWADGDDPTVTQDYGYNEWPSSELTGALMHQTPVGPPRHFTAGQYLRVHAYQFSNNLAALDLDASQSLTPAFWIVRLG